MIDLAVGGGQAHAGAVPGQFLDGLIDGLRGDVRIEFLQCRPQAGGEDDLGLGLAAQDAFAVVKLMKRVDRR
jgi:hypothetical protein